MTYINYKVLNTFLQDCMILKNDMYVNMIIPTFLCTILVHLRIKYLNKKLKHLFIYLK